MTTYKIENNILLISDIVLKFDFPVEQNLLVENILIILLDIPSGVIYNENVFGIDLVKKQIIWRIQKMSNRYVQNYCPYTYMKASNSSIVLSNVCSFYLEIDPSNGNILEEGMWK